MYIDINNVKLYYECYGKGKPILFIPGNDTSFRYMIRLARLLSKEYKVYLLDRRGQGRSTKKCELSYELNVQDIYEFIQKMNIIKPVIFAHSGGATITMMFAIKHKDIADKLILCSGATNLQGTIDKYLRRWKLYSKYNLINRDVINMVLNQKDITDNVREITAKTLVLAGEKDIIMKDNTQTIAEYISNTKLKVYENENHSSYIINTRCYRDIIDFLNE